MATPNALVIRTAGTNCDRETVFALEQAGFETAPVHINRIVENPGALDDFQFIVIPGGFTYGDDISAGKILAAKMARRLGDALNRFVERGNLILGICNGFQVLIKSGLLPWGAVDPARPHRDVTLTWNDCGRFVERWVYLSSPGGTCVFIDEGDLITLPVAHGEGKFVAAAPAVTEKLGAGGQVALRYAPGPDAPDGYVANPNGSEDDIAGICDPSGRILGLMPHPERFVDPLQHPRWTRALPRRADGRVFFEKAFSLLA